MVAVSSYFASVGVRVDNKTLKDVDQFLAKIDKKMQSGTGKKGLLVTPKIDVAAFEKHLRSVLRGFKNNTFRVKVQVSEEGLKKSLDSIFSKRSIRVPITARFTAETLTGLRQQLQAAMLGIPLHANVKVNTSRGRSGAALGTHTGAQYSWSPNPSGKGGSTPHLTEWLAGRPDKSTLSAANRRYGDAIVKNGLLKNINPNSIPGVLSESFLGGLGRVGSSTIAGRGLSSLLGATMGPRAGAIGLIASSIIPAITGSFKMIWSSFGTMISAPFKLVGGAANMVVSGFYRLALAIAPVVAAFAGIDTQVRQTTTRGIAMNTMAERYGSTGAEERRWLMNMSNRDGVIFNDIVDPFVNFVSASAPSMGLEGAKSIYETLVQYGNVHGANPESMKRALVAFGQISSKGQVMAEELKGQIGDAQGFGGMIPIFAEAWSRVQGKDPSTVKEPVKELLDAMSKGNVIASKILPVVEEIARERSKSGVEASRETANAERSRFLNQITNFWSNFSAGGGESGLAKFWKLLQGFGSWLESNGGVFGRRFELLIYDLDIFWTGIKEFADFAMNGTENDLVDIFRSWGINLQEIRKDVLEIFDSLKNIFMGSEGGNWSDTLVTKIQNFSIGLQRILKEVKDMLYSINLFFEGYNEWSQMSWFDKIFMSGEAKMKMFSGVGGATVDAFQATHQAGDMVLNVLGRNTSIANSDYELYGNSRGGFSPQTPVPQIVNQLPSTSPSAVLPPTVNQIRQNVGGEVNVKVEIVGDNDLVSQLNNPESISLIKNTMIQGIGEMCTKSMVDAGLF